MSNLTSCITQDAFLALEPKGKASILNYNLPQETCLQATSYVTFGIPRGGTFSTTVANPPVTHFWNNIANLAVEQVTAILQQELNMAIARDKKALFRDCN